MNLPPMQSFWLNKERAASIAVDVPETGLPTANVGGAPAIMPEKSLWWNDIILLSLP